MRLLVLLAALSLAACSPGDEAQPTPVPDVDIVTPEVAFERIERGDLAVLDVRTPEEFAAGALPGAINVDWKGRGFREALDGFDRSAPVLVHCESGGRSTYAVEALRDLGFEHILHMDGGMRAWRQAGLPVEG